MKSHGQINTPPSQEPEKLNNQAVAQWLVHAKYRQWSHSFRVNASVEKSVSFLTNVLKHQHSLMTSVIMHSWIPAANLTLKKPGGF